MNRAMRDHGPPKVSREVIGLIPAAGHATRISPLPCSKELYPIGFRDVDGDHIVRPKVICHYLLEKMRLAGITEAYIILREGKWDIPAYLGDGALADMHLAYLMMNLPYGVPYTLDQAHAFVKDKLVAVGFPDVLLEPEDVYVRILAQQQASGADVVLGLFPDDQPEKGDMVELDHAGRVRQIVIKTRDTELTHSWMIAVWTPAFTNFMHEYLGVVEKSEPLRTELFLGDVIQAAIENGLCVEGIPVSDSPPLDIGTPEDLVRAVNFLQHGHTVESSA